MIDKEAKAGWGSSWEVATAVPRTVSEVESPKKVPKIASSAMQVDGGNGKDGQEADRATFAATCVGNGGGGEASNLDVYVYAKPDPWLTPSQIGVEKESKWYQSYAPRVAGETEFEAYARAFWGVQGEGNGDPNTQEFWQKIQDGVGWKGHGAKVQCWDCRKEFPRFMLYVSHRDCESLYIAYDMHKKRIVGRCQSCELQVRLKGDLTYYFKKASMTLLKSET